MSENELLPELWDVERLAAYLGVGRTYVYRLTREHRIRFVRAGKELRFFPADVAAFLAAEAVAARPRSAPAAPHRPVAPRRRARVAGPASEERPAAPDAARVRAPW